MQMMEQCYWGGRMGEGMMGKVQGQVEWLMVEMGKEKGVPAEVYECFSEITTQVIPSLISYCTVTSMRLKSLSALIHLHLVQANLQPLTPALNSLIKPILSQSKSEPIPFLQHLTSKSLVSLVALLFQNGKAKSVQQILGIVVKNIESSGENDIGDRGSKQVVKEIIKQEKNILQAYN